MGVKNTFKTIESVRSKLNNRYAMCADNMKDILQNSDSTFEGLVNTFLFGYAQGIKAAKAEMKKGGKKS